MTPDEVDAYITNFQARVIHDAWLESTATYWLRRASELDAARPRPGDFTGAATPADIAATNARLAGAARACRLRASLHAEDLSRVQLRDAFEALAGAGRAGVNAA